VRALFSHLSSWPISLELPARQLSEKNSNHFGTEHKIRLLRQIMNSTTLLPGMSVRRSTD
jgi:hypothetical protein